MGRRDGCSGKVPHRNRRAAQAALKALNNAGLDAYKCPRCYKWHLGNSRSPLKVQARIDQLLGKPQ